MSVSVLPLASFGENEKTLLSFKISRISENLYSVSLFYDIIIDEEKQSKSIIAFECPRAVTSIKKAIDEIEVLRKSLISSIYSPMVAYGISDGNNIPVVGSFNMDEILDGDKTLEDYGIDENNGDLILKKEAESV